MPSLYIKTQTVYTHIWTVDPNSLKTVPSVPFYSPATHWWLQKWTANHASRYCTYMIMKQRANYKRGRQSMKAQSKMPLAKEATARTATEEIALSVWSIFFSSYTPELSRKEYKDYTIHIRSSSFLSLFLSLFRSSLFTKLIKQDAQHDELSLLPRHRRHCRRGTEAGPLHRPQVRSRRLHRRHSLSRLRWIFPKRYRKD